MNITPSHVWKKNISNSGERLVFEILQVINLSKHDHALHSQNLHGGVKQAWSEIDFMVFTEKAIIGIEVKSGVVTCKDGIWYVKDPLNGKVIYSKPKSPLVQVSDALETLRTTFFKKAFSNKYNKVPFVKIAVLCKNHRPDFIAGQSPPELDDNFVIYEEDLDHKTFKQKIIHAITHHIREGHPGRADILTVDNVKEIVQVIRPNIDVSYASSSKSNHLESEQHRLTVEQYELSDRYQFLDRLLVDGGAGTGKTFILAYGAMQEQAKGNKVLILTRSENLVNFIKQSISDDVVCLTGEEFLKRTAQKFDVLFIDEGQDFCSEKFVDKLDSTLSGGLSKGRWRWFGDFENQFSTTSEFDPEILNYLKECTGNNALITMSHNVRNTPSIVGWLETICAARIGKTKVRGAGPEVKIVASDEFFGLLYGDHSSEYFGEFSLAKTVLLYTCKDSLQSVNVQYLLKHSCTISSIEDFKGLESMFVFILDLNEIDSYEALRDQTYKAVSRARAICIINGDNELKKNLRKMMKGLTNAKA